MKELLSQYPIIPVVVIEQIEDAVPLARSLVAGGLSVIEVTLRTPAAIAGIEDIIENVPGAVVGSGTVCSESQLQMSIELGCKFAVSPGATDSLLKKARDSGFNYLPGVSSASEVMRGLEYGFDTFKFFPAEAVGGTTLLKSLQGPFGDVKFCATGGIGLDNVMSYLSLANVLSVGGSWITPSKLIKEKRWSEIERLASQASSLTQ
jgi:2-dehydro-3-deoxyphosphogluconate aldolase/(4S)-4-hydroxy-2-oxoglutarate aldolase